MCVPLLNFSANFAVVKSFIRHPISDLLLSQEDILCVTETAEDRFLSRPSEGKRQVFLSMAPYVLAGHLALLSTAFSLIYPSTLIFLVWLHPELHSQPRKYNTCLSLYCFAQSSS